MPAPRPKHALAAGRRTSSCNPLVRPARMRHLIACSKVGSNGAGVFWSTRLAQQRLAWPGWVFVCVLAVAFPPHHHHHPAAAAARARVRLVGLSCASSAGEAKRKAGQPHARARLQLVCVCCACACVCVGCSGVDDRVGCGGVCVCACLRPPSLFLAALVCVLFSGQAARRGGKGNRAVEGGTQGMAR